MKDYLHPMQLASLNQAEQLAAEDREREEAERLVAEAQDILPADPEDPLFPSPEVQEMAMHLWPRKHFSSITVWIAYVKKWWPKVPAMVAIMDKAKAATNAAH